MSSFVPDSSVAANVEASPNFDERTGLGQPDMIVLHYTGMQVGHDALHRLCDPKARVSAHYLVFENGTITQLVPEAKRAWHAGVSSWSGDTDINSRSIGIEIANPGHDFGYPDFPTRQIAATITLCRSILTRNIIRPGNIVAHSDVAPARKQDPGEKFPWKRLAQSGVGLWVEPVPIHDGPVLKPDDSGDKVTELQKALAEYGYGLEATGHYDEATRIVVAAFQRHFRSAQVDGFTDISTRETLRKLLLARELQVLESDRKAAAEAHAKPAAVNPQTQQQTKQPASTS
ncbi:MAG: N-acetylmuramoyl-L-alanine amidase [Rhizobiales bacterium]|jgi:N-acetylmuramoyl-L-alanine amidase|nr:N-acetylmuramoyl-L-alanine amidase [Hyphomicrobiales bacterium]